MIQGLGFGRRKLISKIITDNWDIKVPDKKIFSYNELLFVIQEMLEEEGKAYLEPGVSMRGHTIFRDFVKHLLYRNLANYDSMVLVTSEKGCILGNSLLEMPRDLIKYPKGIPVRELVGKGPIWVYSFNVNTKQLELKKSDGVEFVKEDDVYEVELTNGQKIQATSEHPFLLTDGSYKQLKDLFWFDRIRENGEHEYGRYQKNKKTVRSDRLRIFSRPYILDLNDNRIKIDYSDIDRKNGDTSLKHSMIEHRFVIEQLIGRKLDYEEIIHHKNKNRVDNNVENLEILDRKTHNFTHGFDKYYFKKMNQAYKFRNYNKSLREHTKINTKDFNKVCKNKRKKFCADNKFLISKISKEREKNNLNSNHIAKGGIIKSIKHVGKKSVFDVTNVRDNHNFIANGFVVSNTGKSSAAIMMARYWCWLLGIRFNPKRHIAYNNSDMMSKIESLNKFEPIIADEAIRFACLAGWCRIKTPNGNVSIEELVGKKNFKVYSFNEKTQKEEIQIAEKCIKVREDFVYEIEMIDGKMIHATAEHKFLTNNGWKTVKELYCGTYIMMIMIGDVNLKSIKSIKKLDKKISVYDIINVSKTNNYIANGVVVHNSSADWAKRENKELKKKLAQVRTKHLLYILCFPLKVQKVDKVYLESNVNYWCLTGDTKITTRNKYGNIVYTRMKYLTKTVELLTYNIKERKYEFKEFNKKILTKKNAEVFEVELINGLKIKATEEHLFLTKRGYIKLRDLKDDDEILVNTKKCEGCGDDFIPKISNMIYCKPKCRYLKHRDDFLRRAKKYREANREKYRLYSINRRKNNPEYVRKLDAEWKLKNYDYVISKNHERWARRMKYDIPFKLRVKLGNQLKAKLKAQKVRKKNSALEFLGCSIEEFKIYLESKFKSGMFWENHGRYGWHIDHIMPCASFDLTKEEDIKKCFHYTNMQPLWWKENLTKHDKVPKGD